MAISYTYFIHPSDKKALDALKAVPYFDYLVKKFMSVYSERINKLQTTSSMIRIGENQLPHIYKILLKVCKKLDISIPELYLTMDREPNAYTMGDSEVFIVIHSGLLETLTLDQVETVIAHECGHILCHHNLYTTMGIYIMKGAEYFINGPISNTIFTAIQYAFFYWMRCSELSADRVSAYYYGSSEQVVDTMMALAGATSNLGFEFNKEEFFKQALEYKELINNSTYNKVLEFITFGLNTHPLIAYRAYEINEFYKKYEAKLLLKSDKNALLNANEYILRIRYEYIKPKNILKLGGVFDEAVIDIIINDQKYSINKNEIKDIVLKNGTYELLISNSNKEIKQSINLQYNMNIVITWDCNKEELSAIEEL